jgi:prevent-host-death family protein
LSEVVKAAKTKGPQIITVRGKEEVAVVSIFEFRKLNSSKRGKPFWHTAPKIELPITRSREPGRDVEQD